MKKILKIATLLILITLAALGIWACSGDDNNTANIRANTCNDGHTDHSHQALSKHTGTETGTQNTASETAQDCDPLSEIGADNAEDLLSKVCDAGNLLFEPLRLQQALDKLIQEKTTTLDGNCPNISGNVSLTGTAAEGTVSFNTFCHTITGSMTVNGTVTFSTATMLQVTFNQVNITGAGTDLTVNGTVGDSAAPVTITDNQTGQVFNIGGLSQHHNGDPNATVMDVKSGADHVHVARDDKAGSLTIEGSGSGYVHNHAGGATFHSDENDMDGMPLGSICALKKED